MANVQHRKSNLKASNAGKRLSVMTKKQELHYSGPLPPAEQLAQYEQISPGAADRLIGLVEKQQNHRHELELSVVRANARNSLLGVISGLIIAVVTVVCSCYAIISGYGATGIIGSIVPLASLVGVFVYGKIENRKEREEKQKIMGEINKK